jgi:hypothetical protein
MPAELQIEDTHKFRRLVITRNCQKWHFANDGCPVIIVHGIILKGSGKTSGQNAFGALGL